MLTSPRLAVIDAGAASPWSVRHLLTRVVHGRMDALARLPQAELKGD